MCRGLQVEWLLILSDFNKIRNLSTNFTKNPKYEILRNLLLWRWHFQNLTDWCTGMTNLIVAFCYWSALPCFIQHATSFRRILATDLQSIMFSFYVQIASSFFGLSLSVTQNIVPITNTLNGGIPWMHVCFLVNHLLLLLGFNQNQKVVKVNKNSKYKMSRKYFL
jgi:hypothetical protein